MLHEPAARVGRDASTDYKTRIGVWMFIIYALVYAGFVAVNVIMPLAMGRIVLGGMNLAVTYGIGLIVFALLLALVYERLCTLRERRMRVENGETN
jgi:uncharacterized membrane protein (DUF485 family)